MDHQKVIALLQNRNPQGMSHLYDLYSASIYGVVTRIVKNEEVAKEVLQETFLKAWKSFEKFDEGKSSLYTWLSVVARNTSIDKIRLKSYQNHEKTTSHDPLVHTSESTSQNEASLDVKYILNKLEDKYRIVVEKIYLEGYSHGDLAEELNIPKGTIKTRLRTALGFLREDLSKEKKLFFGILFVSLILLLLWQ